MKRIVLTIKNNSKKNYKSLELFGFKEEKDMPEGIETKLEIIENGKSIGDKKMTYQDLVNQIKHKPCVVDVFKTTNNRRVDFYSLDVYGVRTPAEPSLTKYGNPRPERRVKCTDGETTWYESEYVKPWNPKVLNIADTHESFILTSYVLITLNIKAGQEFKIHFRPSKQIIVIENKATANINNVTFVV